MSLFPKQHQHIKILGPLSYICLAKKIVADADQLVSKVLRAFEPK